MFAFYIDFRMSYTYKTFESSGSELKIILKMSPALALLTSGQNSNTSVVAYEGSVPVGLLISQPHGTTSIYIAHIHVLEPHRRKGIATELIKRIENVAKQKSLQTLCLIVN
ncbi:hypothetical protein HA402_005744, partial [Bradysia odoriphaga]